MEVTFKRRLTNELLTTYLPSFFLLGISYATTHFKPFYFEAAVTVNLTVMLVATTLFVRWNRSVIVTSDLCYILLSILITINGNFESSLMARLPPASYLRLVDIWLISTQLVPFIQVALMTLLELYNNTNMDINHHGFKRLIYLMHTP